MPSVLILPQGTRLVECTTQGVRLDTQGFIWELCNGYLHLSRYAPSQCPPSIHTCGVGVQLAGTQSCSATAPQLLRAICSDTLRSKGMNSCLTVSKGCAKGMQRRKKKGHLNIWVVQVQHYEPAPILEHLHLALHVARIISCVRGAACSRARGQRLMAAPRHGSISALQLRTMSCKIRW